MAEPLVLIDTIGPVRKLTLNRPAALNSFTSEMHRELRAALDAAASQRSFEVFYPEPELCTDNGAMIAFAAALRLPQEASGEARFTVKPRWDLEG